MNRTDKVLSFLTSHLVYWLRVAELVTATPGAGPLAAWLISLLEIHPAERILEIGCGPEMIMKSILKADKQALVAAVDPSAILVEEAWQRNFWYVRQGRAMLIRTTISTGLPTFSAPFTKVVGVNPTALTEQPVDSLKAIRSVMAQRAKIILAVKSTDKDASVADARRLAKELRQHLAAAGFVSLSLIEKDLRPAPAACVTGINPANPEGHAVHHGGRHKRM